jgi:hypothetical protein
VLVSNATLCRPPASALPQTSVAVFTV